VKEGSWNFRPKSSGHATTVCRRRARLRPPRGFFTDPAHLSRHLVPGQRPGRTSLGTWSLDSAWKGTRV
jgi:hypothetical protein